MKKILITGSAGFIGYHLSKALSKKNKVIGIDSFERKKFNKISNDRISDLRGNKNFKFIRLSITNLKKMEKLFKNNYFDIVINLAAIPGVRESFINPDIYFKNNIEGFYNIYMLSIKNKVKLFLFGSSSSVYGNNKNLNTDNPISFYASTKKCNEIIAHSFLLNSKMKIVGLRYFTVYGPWGRPDMAVYKFSNNIKNQKKINVYNFGNHSRDFSYIDDVINSIELIIKNKKKLKNYQILDIGKGKTDKLNYLILLIQKYFNARVNIKKISKQLGDVEITKANIKNLIKITKYSPNTSLTTGIERFVKWYKIYHKN